MEGNAVNGANKTAKKESTEPNKTPNPQQDFHELNFKLMTKPGGHHCKPVLLTNLPIDVT
jgi:hypothetical protein